MNLQAIFAWLTFIENVVKAGKPAVDAVLDAARDHGVEMDNEHLDAVKADAERRADIARREAQG